MAGEGSTSSRGFVGGRQDLRALHGESQPLAHAAVIDLYGPDAARDRERVTAFRAEGPLEIEIGFGRGRFLAERAAARPESRFLAFEVRTRWCLSLLEAIDERGLTNIRVLRADARSVLAEAGVVPDGSVAAFYLLFPDPWWKKRHHRRRVIAPPWFRLIHRKLAPGGALWVKSDVPMTVGLADEVVAEIAESGCGGFERTEPRPDDVLPATHRELRCQRVGLPVMARRYEKRD